MSNTPDIKSNNVSGGENQLGVKPNYTPQLWHDVKSWLNMHAERLQLKYTSFDVGRNVGLKIEKNNAPLLVLYRTQKALEVWVSSKHAYSKRRIPLAPSLLKGWSIMHVQDSKRETMAKELVTEILNTDCSQSKTSG